MRTRTRPSITITEQPGITAAAGLAIEITDPEVAWSGVLVVEGVWTGDGRFIEEGATTWADLPLPFMVDRAFLDGGGDGHFGSFLGGRIDTIERVGNEIRGTGVFDAENADVVEVVRKVYTQMANGVSIDPDQVEIAEYDEVEEGFVFSALRIRGATLTPFQAFVEAFIDIDDTLTETDTTDGEEDDVEEAASLTDSGTLTINVDGVPPVVVASIPVAPPADWFVDPAFTDLQQHITVTPEGRISGHLAPLNECHIGYTNRCLTAASMVSDWRYFTTGYVACDDGCRIPTGPITLVGGHAPLNLPWNLAKRHYDDTDSAMADVALGVDEHGIWFAGALRPDVTPSEIRTLLASGVSGDWRPAPNPQSRLELCGICAVNMPGYPKALGVRVASGMVEAVVASAAGSLHYETPGETLEALAGDRFAALERRLARAEAVLRTLDGFARERLAMRMPPPVRRPSAFRSRRPSATRSV